MRLKLRTKIALLIVFLVLIIQGANFYLSHFRTYEIEVKQSSAGAQDLAKLIALSQTEHLLEKGDFDRKTLRVLSGAAFSWHPEFAYFVLLDEKAQVLDGMINEKMIEKDNTKSLLDNLTFLHEAGGLHKGLRRVTVGIEVNESLAGTIEVGLSLLPFREKIKEATLWNLAGAAVFLALGILVSFWLARKISSPVSLLEKSMQEVRKGNFEIQVQIQTGDELQSLGDTFNFMSSGLKEREKIKNVFSRYISRQVAERIIDKVVRQGEQLRLDGENRRVTIMFSDIRGFTPIAEQMSPEEVVSLLNEYFKAMVEIIFKYEGTLDKFAGDEIMAFFGAPQDQDEPELRAVKTALEMLEALQHFNERLGAEDKPAIRIGIGINTGNVVAGSVGSEEHHMEYTVIGDAVNLSKRIESQASSSILISETTYQAVRDKIVANPIGPVQVKGKKEPVLLFQVTSLREESS